MKRLHRIILSTTLLTTTVQACELDSLDFTNNLDILIEYSRNNPLEEVHKLLKKENKGEKLLAIGLKENNIPMIKKLLELGFPADYRGQNGLTSLLIATKHNKTLIMKELLQHNADVNLKGKGTADSISPLYTAAFEGYTEALDLLLSYNPDIDAMIKEDLHLYS